MSPFNVMVALAIIISTVVVVYAWRTEAGFPGNDKELAPWLRVSISAFIWLITDLICLIPVGIVMFLVMACLSSSAPKHHLEWETSSVSLISLQDNAGVQGSVGGNFLLISGEINQATYYSYWYKDGDGFRHGQLTDANNVVVYEDAADDPRLVTITQWDGSCYGWDWAQFTFCNDPGGSWTAVSAQIHKFHVPPGTVIRKISLGN